MSVRSRENAFSAARSDACLRELLVLKAFSARSGFAPLNHRSGCGPLACLAWLASVGVTDGTVNG